jgi:hypothetical protein
LRLIYSGFQINGVQGGSAPAWRFHPHTPYLTPVRIAIQRSQIGCE